MSTEASGAEDQASPSSKIGAALLGEVSKNTDEAGSSSAVSPEVSKPTAKSSSVFSSSAKQLNSVPSSSSINSSTADSVSRTPANLLSARAPAWYPSESSKELLKNNPSAFTGPVFPASPVERKDGGEAGGSATNSQTESPIPGEGSSVVNGPSVLGTGVTPFSKGGTSSSKKAKSSSVTTAASTGSITPKTNRTPAGAVWGAFPADSSGRFKSSRNSVGSDIGEEQQHHCSSSGAAGGSTGGGSAAASNDGRSPVPNDNKEHTTTTETNSKTRSPLQPAAVIYPTTTSSSKEEQESSNQQQQQQQQQKQQDHVIMEFVPMPDGLREEEYIENMVKARTIGGEIAGGGGSSVTFDGSGTSQGGVAAAGLQAGGYFLPRPVVHLEQDDDPESGGSSIADSEEFDQVLEELDLEHVRKGTIPTPSAGLKPRPVKKMGGGRQFAGKPSPSPSPKISSRVSATAVHKDPTVGGTASDDIRGLEQSMEQDSSSQKEADGRSPIHGEPAPKEEDGAPREVPNPSGEEEDGEGEDGEEEEEDYYPDEDDLFDNELDEDEFDWIEEQLQQHQERNQDPSLFLF